MTDERDGLRDWVNDLRPRSAARAAAKPAYEAFKPVDRRQLRLQVCPSQKAWEWFQYLGLQRIVTDADYGTRLALIWSHAVVVIEGRNLQELDKALATEHVDAIRAFDPTRFDPPTNQASPIIDRIEIIVERQGDTNKPEASSSQPAH